LIPVLSAWENIEYPLMLLGVPAAERRERSTRMLEAVVQLPSEQALSELGIG
jgi:putative ABC transport system ATP-binding protein